MFDITDLDLRYRQYQERIAASNLNQPAPGTGLPPPRRLERLRFQVAWALARLSCWLAPEQTGTPELPHDSAIA